ncbi:MAG: antibiotic biosynthesis monooxygenase family protein [Desulfobacterales bacterium]
MAVKIMIKRKVSSDKILDLMPYLKQLRVLAMNQEGYIGGETLKRIDDPEEFLVVSTWQSMDHWDAWFKNPQRNELQQKIDALLGNKTEYSIYVYQ